MPGGLPVFDPAVQSTEAAAGNAERMRALHYQFPGFRLDPLRRQLLSWPSGEPVDLMPKSFETLLHLVIRRGVVVEKDELLKAVWPHVIVEENNLERHVSVLRRALGEIPGQNRFIVTVPGRGYSFVAPVVEVDPVIAAQTGAADGQKDALPPSRRTRRMPVLVLLAAGAAAIAGFARTCVPATAEPVVAAVSGVSVAVLSFENLTGDPGLDYIGEGIADEMYRRLQRRPGFLVPGPPSYFAYRGRGMDLRQIAEDLGVEYLLIGTTQGSLKHLRVTVYLVEAATGQPAWLAPYDLPFSDVFELHEAIGTEVVQRISLGMLSGTPTSDDLAPPTHDIEAYRLFLEANAMTGASESNLRRALELYDEALELDPDYARALAARSRVLLSQLTFGFASPEVVDAADHDARRAIELDEGLAGGHAALGMVELTRGNYLEAERLLLKAHEMDGGDASLLGATAMLLASTGRLDDAIEVSERAFRIAPLALPTGAQLASLYALTGRLDDAMHVVSRIQPLGVPMQSGAIPLIRAEAQMRAGRPREAAKLLARTMQPKAQAAGAEAVLAQVYEAYLQPRKRPAAADALRRLVDREGIEAIDRFQGRVLMTLFAMVDDLDSAFVAANHAIDYYSKGGSVGYPWYSLWAEPMSNFRRDPQFRELTVRLRMPEYWAVHGQAQACESRGRSILCQ